jgi:hypothetical protein
MKREPPTPTQIRMVKVALDKKGKNLPPAAEQIVNKPLTKTSAALLLDVLKNVEDEVKDPYAHVPQGIHTLSNTSKPGLIVLYKIRVSSSGFVYMSQLNTTLPEWVYIGRDMNALAVLGAETLLHPDDAEFIEKFSGFCVVCLKKAHGQEGEMAHPRCQLVLETAIAKARGGLVPTLATPETKRKPAKAKRPLKRPANMPKDRVVGNTVIPATSRLAKRFTQPEA